MFSKFQKKTMMCMIIIFTLLMVMVVLTANPYLTAHAASYKTDSPLPTFGLYCEEEGIIKKGSVKFDLSDTDMFSNKKAVKESEYTISGNKVVTFEIPFISSYIEIPQFSVTVNGEEVNGDVWYGNNEIWYGGSGSFLGALSTDNSIVEQKLKMTYSPVLDETIIGTLYTVIPNDEAMSITLNLEKPCCYVYDGNNRSKESYLADGTMEWSYENALSQECYQYLFIGKNAVNDFSTTCEFQTKEISFKDFVNSNYNDNKDYYEECGATIYCLYANANRLLQTEGGCMALRELFYNSLNGTGINSYKFIVELDGEATIKYSSEVVIQADYRYEPTVYLIGQKQVGTYPTNYSITLNDEVPYLVQSSVKTKKSKKTYTASSTENFYFISCSVSWQSGLSTAQLAICIVCGVVGGVAIVVLVVNTILAIRERKKYKWRL